MELSGETVEKMLEILLKEYPKWKAPIVTFVAETMGLSDNSLPFRVLVATILSLRTKDETTTAAVTRLFSETFPDPQSFIKLGAGKIEKLIYPVGFYRVKSQRLVEISQILIEKFDGKVPSDIEELLTLPGVGRKTANLVVSLGYGKPAMCVDIHVHRISNRWGYIATKTPEQSEFALREKLPVKWWNRYNDILVAFGQTICKPVSPFCSRCAVEEWCLKAGVDRHR
jgi:endonuclease-3